ncbi:MAG: DnaJ domain-containing protein [Spirochaetes bacterium]|nr:DnaJ domain-containing protein [Spirochaetota bacterium]
MAIKNFYDLLNLDFQASTEAVKRHYRILVKRYHPDSGCEEASEEMFRLITQAYKILTDEKKRLKYNEKLFRIKVKKPRVQIPRPKIKVIYSRSLGVLAKRGFFITRLSSKARRKRDIKYDIEVFIDYYQAQKGGVIDIFVPTKYPCPYCQGSDHYCRLCEGKSYIIRSQPIKVLVPASPASGEIFEIDLGKIKQKNCAVIRAQKLRIKIILSHQKTTFKQLPG